MNEMSFALYALVPIALVLAYKAGYGHGYREGDSNTGGWEEEALEWRAIIKNMALSHLECECAGELESGLGVVEAQDKS